MHRRFLFGVLAMAVGVVVLAFGWVAPAAGRRRRRGDGVDEGLSRSSRRRSRSPPAARCVDLRRVGVRPDAELRVAAIPAAQPVACPGHSTTAVDKGPDGKPVWDSGVHRADGFPFTHTSPTPGTYHYICRIHGGADANNPVTHMEGDVVVAAAVATAAGTGGGSAPNVDGSAPSGDAPPGSLPATGAGNRLAAAGVIGIAVARS